MSLVERGRRTAVNVKEPSRVTTPPPPPPAPRSSCPGCADLTRQLADALAALDAEVSRRTIGGTPPAPDASWGNRALGSPDSASDETAPPHRRVGMQSSLDVEEWT